jgi:hypothetical protein
MIPKHGPHFHDFARETTLDFSLLGRISLTAQEF